MSNKELREILNEFISIVENLEEECENAKTASTCHLEYFKSQKISVELDFIVSDKISKFIEKHKSDKVAMLNKTLQMRNKNY